MRLNDSKWEKTFPTRSFFLGKGPVEDTIPDHILAKRKQIPGKLIFSLEGVLELPAKNTTMNLNLVNPLRI